ncbi:hypothetical protein [Aureispira anguillae]|uniref:Uncharacterized protein n=1 Tax=Aureispira anguillae TaxID=2864201 RepID=A0A915YGW3_9BACT|nr:hypothetical protein [Aureispira anguillae]BDS12766.1 hypothetical protein AsAng_0034910 [Aureispira anguillae]
MDSKAKRLGRGRFRLEDGREVRYAPVKGEQLSWERVYRQTILTKEEERKGKILRYDLTKVLKVKRGLEQGMRPMKIHQTTGIARSTIDKYRKILCEKDIKLQGKDTQTTEKLHCVFFNSLICSDLGLNATPSLLLLLAPLLMLMLWGWLKGKWLKEQQEHLAHQQEADRLRKLMYQVKNLSFQREPLICTTKVEATYYKDLLKHFNNRGRTVELIERKLNQSSHQHAASRSRFNEHYYSTHKHKIAEGQQRAREYWEGLIEAGLLDYLSSPKGANWEASKAYIEAVTAYLVANPKPKASDQAKQKLALDLLTSNTIEFKL